MASYIMNRTLTTEQKCPFQHYKIIAEKDFYVSMKGMAK
jgi:hypothetical protein